MRYHRNAGFFGMLGLFIAVLAAGCGDAKKIEVTDQSVDRKNMDPVESFLQGMRSYNGQDLAEVMTMFEPGVVWHNHNAMDAEIKGRSSLAKQLLGERTVFPDSKIGIEKVYVFGSNLVMVGVFKGTQQGPIRSIPATGKKIAYNLLYFVDMDGGRVKKIDAYFNMASALRQIEVIRTLNTAMPKWPQGKPEVVRGAENKDVTGLVKGFFAALEASDLERLGALASGDLVYNDKAEIKSYEGLEEVKNILQEERAEFLTVKFKVRELETHPDFAAAQVQLVGQHVAQKNGKKDPPRAVTLDRAYLFSIKDGKIAAIDLYRDELALYREYGVKPMTAVLHLSDKPAPPKDAEASAQEGTGSDKEAGQEASKEEPAKEDAKAQPAPSKPTVEKQKSAASAEKPKSKK